MNLIVKNIGKAANPVIAKALSGITYEYPIGNTGIIVDYHISSLNITTQLAVQAAFNGTFYNNGTVAAYVAPVSLPAWATQDDLKLQLSQYVFDSLLQAIQLTNKLSFNITQETIPSTVPIILTTTGLKFLIPSLETVYGTNVPVTISLLSYQAPVFNITSDVDLEIFLQIAFNVLTPNPVSAFTVDWDATTQVDMSLSEINSTTYLIAQVIANSTVFSDMRLVSSNIGPLNTAQIQSGLSWLANNILSYLSKYYLAAGIALPIPSSIDLAASSINIGQGVIEVDAIPVLAN